jgi:hypothetical protein
MMDLVQLADLREECPDRLLISALPITRSAPPHDSGYPNGGVFEMRTYQLQPGKLLEWEASWISLASLKVSTQARPTLSSRRAREVASYPLLLALCPAARFGVPKWGRV